MQICDFSKAQTAPGDQIRLPSFSCHGFEWYLVVYPRGNGPSVLDERRQKVTIYLHIVPKSMATKRECQGKIEIGIPSLGVTAVFVKHFRLGASDQVPPLRVDRKVVLVKGCANDVFTITGSIQVLRSSAELGAIPTPPLPTISSGASRLDQQRFMRRGELPNITFLVGKDGISFPAFSDTIKARCPIVWDFIEATEDGDDTMRFVELFDIEPRLFQDFLSTMFANGLRSRSHHDNDLDTQRDSQYEEDVEDADTSEVLMAAIRCRWWRLQLYLEIDLVQRELDKYTAIDLFVFASSNRCAVLKEAAAILISADLSSFMARPEWNQLESSSKLKAEVQELFCGNYEYDGNTSSVVSNATLLRGLKASVAKDSKSVGKYPAGRAELIHFWTVDR